VNSGPHLCEHFPPSDGYDAADDLKRSVEFAYKFIRTRTKNGGRGWGGWPTPADLDPSRNDDGGGR
jgi:hypothetical protein